MVGVVQLRTWPVHMPPTVPQPLARPESAVGRCWRAAHRPEASRIHCEPNGLIAFFWVFWVFFGAGYGWHLGPDCDGFWPRASFLPLKSGS
jgi:hypothetical protein